MDQPRRFRQETADEMSEKMREVLSTIKFQEIDPDLFNTKAHDAAKEVARNRGGLNNPTQLRRFYDELMLWESKVAREPERFEEYLPFIRMINAKVAYANGRKLVDKNFLELMQHTLKEVVDASTLKTCKLFWEAFMGFYKLERPK